MDVSREAWAEVHPLPAFAEREEHLRQRASRLWNEDEDVAVCLVEIDRLRAASTLDAAWAAVEAALPEGWNATLYSHRQSGQYVAYATTERGDTPFVAQTAPAQATPAAALYALAEKLAQR